MSSMVWQEICEWMAFTDQPSNGMWGKWKCESRRFVVLRGSHKTVCDVETENQSNPTHFPAEPASGNFPSVVDTFQDGKFPLQRCWLVSPLRTHWHCIVVCTGYFPCLADGLFASSNAGIRGLFKAASGFLSKYSLRHTIFTPLICWVVSPRHNFTSVSNSSNAVKPWGEVSIVEQLPEQNKSLLSAEV